MAFLMPSYQDVFETGKTLRTSGSLIKPVSGNTVFICTTSVEFGVEAQKNGANKQRENLMQVLFAVSQRRLLLAPMF